MVRLLETWTFFPFHPFISFVLDCHKFSGEFSGAPLICRKATELTFSFHFTFTNIFNLLEMFLLFFLWKPVQWMNWIHRGFSTNLFLQIFYNFSPLLSKFRGKFLPFFNVFFFKSFFKQNLQGNFTFFQTNSVLIRKSFPFNFSKDFIQFLLKFTDFLSII